MFQLTKEELENWKSQTVISNSIKMGLRKPPLVFTEQGVYMLATVLKSQTAVEVTKQIMSVFTKMRNFLLQNANLFQKIEEIEKRQITYEIKTDEKIDKIFKALEDKSIKPTQGIFFDGQIFDAYVFVNNLIKSAKKSIKLIDNYVDESVLMLFGKVKNIEVTIYTKTISKQLKLDLKKYNLQYGNIKAKKFDLSHDRFLIIDDKEIYHIGTSLKDLGKKWFAFSKMDNESLKILDKMTENLYNRLLHCVRGDWSH